MKGTAANKMIWRKCSNAKKLAELRKLTGKTGDELAGIITEYQAISEVLSRIISHADLKFAADMAEAKNGQYAQDMREAAATLTSQLLFVEAGAGNAG